MAAVLKMIHALFLSLLGQPSAAADEDSSGIRSISNAELTEADIPGDDAQWTEWPGVWAFAARFRGYDYLDSPKRPLNVGTSPLRYSP